MIKNLGKTNSVINQYIAEIRDVEIQQDSMRFRRNLYRIGEVVAMEISKTLEYEQKEVITSLGSAIVPVLNSYPVIIPILRAGLPIHDGVLNIFDRSVSAFVSAYRKVEKNEEFTIQVEYISSPDLSDRIIIICDPMLATGASVVTVYKALLNFGKPKHTHIISAISSVEGVNYLKKKLSSKEITVWTCAIDEELTAQAYIVPGLGDAGDLAFGKKTS